MSINHQFVQHSEKTVKKYVRTTNKAVTGFRLDPNRLENRIDWLLASPDNAFEVIWIDGEEVKVIRKPGMFEYEDEVLELYSQPEVDVFKRLNRGLLERGILVEYEGELPQLDMSKVFTDVNIAEIAATKNILSLRKKLQDITNVETINRILAAAEKLDRPMSVAKAIQDRKRELIT